MRILVLNQYFHPDQASTSQLLTELCVDLSEHHEVTVVAGRPSYDATESSHTRGLVIEDQHRNIRVLRTWSTTYARSNMAGRLTNYATYLASCFAGAFKAVRPDAILTMTDPPVVAAAAMLTSRVRHVPFVYVNQDVFPEVALALRRLRRGPVAWALARLNGSLRRSAARVVVIGRDMEQRLLETGVPRERLALIPNWADGGAIRPLEGPSTLRAERGWQELFVVMHSGNVGLSQSLDTLVAAAALLRSEPQIRLAVVGEGASKEALVRRAKELQLDNLEFLPYQPKASLSDSLGAADLHVVALRRGLGGYIVPSKLYGVMAAGKPFVAAIEPHTEPSLVAEEHGCGVVVEPDDPRALANAILQARQLPLGEMGRRGREAFERLYDRPIATAAYRQLLEEVASRG
jgi:colanic acid biosynthesis glycosyl transferase WcaI